MRTEQERLENLLEKVAVTEDDIRRAYSPALKDSPLASMYAGIYGPAGSATLGAVKAGEGHRTEGLVRGGAGSLLGKTLAKLVTRKLHWYPRRVANSLAGSVGEYLATKGLVGDRIRREQKALNLPKEEAIPVEDLPKEAAMATEYPGEELEQNNPPAIATEDLGKSRGSDSLLASIAAGLVPGGSTTLGAYTAGPENRMSGAGRGFLGSALAKGVTRLAADRLHIPRQEAKAAAKLLGGVGQYAATRHSVNRRRMLENKIRAAREAGAIEG